MCKATLKEFERFSKRVSSMTECMKYATEWEAAILFGWDHDEFIRLYHDYVESTQATKEDNPGVSWLELKGRPLEYLATFFLKHGGIVHDLVEVNAPRRWQVDGQGLLYRQGLIDCFGRTEAEKFGPQLYMEAKNHSSTMSNGDYATHCLRMGEHRCNVGVIFSSSGYSIRGGDGIARSISTKTIQGVFNILFTVDVFKRVIDEDKPPLFLIREAYDYAVNEKYENDSDLQARYSETHCHQVALDEYERYFGSGGSQFFSVNLLNTQCYSSEE